MALAFGVLIVTDARLADLFGRKRVFLIGATIFGAFSLVRGLMWPVIVGMSYQLLPEGGKGLVAGLILGVAGLDNTVGPLLAGWLADTVSWRLVFFVNSPLTGFAILVTQREVAESRATGGSHRID